MDCSSTARFNFKPVTGVYGMDQFQFRLTPLTTVRQSDAANLRAAILIYVLRSALFLFHRHQNKTEESGERERAKKKMRGGIAFAKEVLAKEILQYPIPEGGRGETGCLGKR